ncbi:hypothetical protein B0H14DRAFT_2616165 [Mycena olivaceomarginata]|nr:hypothetical protein B0H14DRAFT_2616165 [Mycena olivaceomarginata]
MTRHVDFSSSCVHATIQTQHLFSKLPENVNRELFSQILPMVNPMLLLWKPLWTESTLSQGDFQRALRRLQGTVKIARVIKNSHGENNDTPTTFNRRMDILFGEDCRNSQGRLPNILRGAAGMPLVVKYLQKIEWSEIEAQLARPKLDRIIKELEFLSNEPTGKSKRKTPELSSDVEEVSPPKRIRTTSQGSVTIEDIDEDDHNFSPDEDKAEKGKYSYPYRTDQLNQYAASAVSRGDNSDVSMSSDDETRPSQKNVLGPGGKKSHITKQGMRTDDAKNKRPAATSSDPSAVDASGMLVDVDVQEIEAPKAIEGPTKDVNHFGGKPFLKKGKAGIDKLHRKAETVADPSTFRRHLQKYHKPEYQEWAKKNNFESRLPDDVKERGMLLEFGYYKKRFWGSHASIMPIMGSAWARRCTRL